jgi:hypothetical protein
VGDGVGKDGVSGLDGVGVGSDSGVDVDRGEGTDGGNGVDIAAVESVAPPGRSPRVRPLQIIGVPGVVCEGDACEVPAGS